MAMVILKLQIPEFSSVIKFPGDLVKMQILRQQLWHRGLRLTHLHRAPRCLDAAYPQTTLRVAKAYGTKLSPGDLGKNYWFLSPTARYSETTVPAWSSNASDFNADGIQTTLL